MSAKTADSDPRLQIAVGEADGNLVWKQLETFSFTRILRGVFRNGSGFMIQARSEKREQAIFGRKWLVQARVAELADALDSGSSE